MTIYIWQNDHQMAIYDHLTPTFLSYPSPWTVSNNWYFQKMTEILTKPFQEWDETLMKDKNNSSGGDLCSNLWAICV